MLVRGRWRVLALAALVLLVGCDANVAAGVPATPNGAATAAPATPDASAGAASPTGTAPPAATSQPAATPSRPSVVVNNATRFRNQVALTFDSDSPGGQGLEIMEWLVAHGTPASIFMTGDWTDNTVQGPPILRAVESHPELFTLGNHSNTHPHFPELTPEQMAAELHAAEAAFRKFCSQDPRPFWRPPYGEINDLGLQVAGAAGYKWTVLADVGIPDWRSIDMDPPGPTADEIIRTAVRKTKPGTIIGLHLGGYNTLAALPGMVSELRRLGFELVTLDTLLGS